MPITFTLNDQTVEAREGQTVLEVARASGVVIPTLCYHRQLPVVGSCRLCVVEVEGARVPQAACGLAAREGMVVRTETPEVVCARRTILELLLANSHDDGLRPDTEFMGWVKKYGAARPAELTPRAPQPVNSDPNPFVWVDMNKCILCTRCVRACADVQGRFVWRTDGRGAATEIVAGLNTTMLEARCESCGACAAFCPTGALSDKMSIQSSRPDKTVTTTCPYCGVGCQFDLNIKEDHIVRVTSNPDAPVNGMHLCVKGRYGYDFVHHPDRVKRPLVREYLLKGKPRTNGNRGEWVDTDWDTALSITARKLREARDAHGPDSVGVLTSAKCLNEENYLMNKFARQVIGTNNIDHCARL
jgi:formate dehydrogenase major subunit/formate dehydrogenase alpha subunit